MTRLTALPSSLLSIATVTPGIAARASRLPGSGVSASFADLVTPVAKPSLLATVAGAGAATVELALPTALTMPTAVAMPMPSVAPGVAAATSFDEASVPGAPAGSTAIAGVADAGAGVDTATTSLILPTPSLAPTAPVVRWQADAGTGKTLPTATTALPQAGAPALVPVPTTFVQAAALAKAGTAPVSSPTKTPGANTTGDILPDAAMPAPAAPETSSAGTAAASPVPVIVASIASHEALVAAKAPIASASRSPMRVDDPTGAATSTVETGTTSSTDPAARVFTAPVFTVRVLTVPVAVGRNQAAAPETAAPASGQLPPTPLEDGAEPTIVAADTVPAAREPASVPSVTDTGPADIVPVATHVTGLASGKATPPPTDDAAPGTPAYPGAGVAPVAARRANVPVAATSLDDTGSDDTDTTPDGAPVDVPAAAVDPSAVVLAGVAAVPVAAAMLGHTAAAPSAPAPSLAAVEAPTSTSTSTSTLLTGTGTALVGAPGRPAGSPLREPVGAGARSSTPAAPVIDAATSSVQAGAVAADAPSVASAALATPVPVATGAAIPREVATPPAIASAPAPVPASASASVAQSDIAAARPSGIAAAPLATTALAPSIMQPGAADVAPSAPLPGLPTASAASPASAAIAVPDALPASGAAGRVFAAALHTAAGPVAKTQDSATVQGTDAPDPMVAALLATAAPIQAGDAANLGVAAGATTAIDLRHAAWPAKMAEQIEALRDGADAISTRVRISPDALGPVDLQIRRDGDRVHVHFAASNAETRSLIADAQPQLAAAAADRGLKLGQTSVGAGGTGDGAQTWSGDQPARQPANQSARPQPVASTRSTRPAATADDAATNTRIA